MSKFREVPIELLRKSFSPKVLGFKTTKDAPEVSGTIGQDRAIKALELGTAMTGTGYNVYATGQPGTGRKEAIRKFLEELPQRQTDHSDLVYVWNFFDDDRPQLLTLKPGEGVELKKDMEVLVETVSKNAGKVLESEEISKARKGLIESFQEREVKLEDNLRDKVMKEKFDLITITSGDGSRVRLEVAPLMAGTPLPMKMLEKQMKDGVISKKVFTQHDKKYKKLNELLEETLKEKRQLGRELKQKLNELKDAHLSPMVDDHIGDLKSKFNNQQVSDYLDQAKGHMIHNIERLNKASGAPTNEREAQHQFMQMLLSGGGSQNDPTLPYKVNVVVDNSLADEGSPIIVENHPNYKNLFGGIERLMDARGGIVTDFTRIKSGSLLRANGGYLVMDAVDMLTEYGSWPTLKRILKSGELQIQNFDPFGYGGSILKPEPIKIDVKVILTGGYHIYQLLRFYDEDFQKVFKVRADFDSVMSAEDNYTNYAAHIKSVVEREGLLHFTDDGVAGIVEHGMREAGYQKKLSTRFGIIDDLIREASYWSKKEGKDVVDYATVDKALSERRYRLGMIEERLQEMIQDGMILIDTDAMVVGQINGLAVYDFGDFMFGKPSRVTAQVSLGSNGLVNIEREAKMSGKIHDKGVLTISGFMKGRYAKEHPLSMDASITFEQNYGGVEGDSASSTEVFALLSAISGAPINQGLAVTGSVDQRGQIQPIGGVNDKIEGFFDVCNERGLDGRHGVIIPHQNVEELMLRNDIVQAVKDGKFHVYPIRTIDEGIQILTGKESKEIDEAVSKRLKEMYELMKPEKGEKDKK